MVIISACDSVHVTLTWYVMILPKKKSQHLRYVAVNFICDWTLTENVLRYAVTISPGIAELIGHTILYNVSPSPRFSITIDEWLTLAASNCLLAIILVLSNMSFPGPWDTHISFWGGKKRQKKVMTTSMLALPPGLPLALAPPGRAMPGTINGSAHACVRVKVIKCLNPDSLATCTSLKLHNPYPSIASAVSIVTWFPSVQALGSIQVGRDVTFIALRKCCHKISLQRSENGSHRS